MSAGAITAEFIDSSRGRILALAHHSKNFDGRCVLVAPPFAEEMNKSRRMVTELAQRLSARGFGVVVPDYFGTGDSQGEFADTDCATWLDDLAATAAWMRRRNWSVDSILGVRLGCIVAMEFARRESVAPRKVVFWQPVLDGNRAFEQFLRMRVAASLMEDKKETVADLKAKFASGEVVEVAGYELSPRLATQIETLKMFSSLSEWSRPVPSIHWFEVLRSAEASVPLPTAKLIDQLTAGGLSIQLSTVIGEPFWASAELVTVPELLDGSADAISSAAS